MIQAWSCARILHVHECVGERVCVFLGGVHFVRGSVWYINMCESDVRLLLLLTTGLLLQGFFLFYVLFFYPETKLQKIQYITSISSH